MGFNGVCGVHFPFHGRFLSADETRSSRGRDSAAATKWDGLSGTSRFLIDFKKIRFTISLYVLSVLPQNVDDSFIYVIIRFHLSFSMKLRLSSLSKQLNKIEIKK